MTPTLLALSIVTSKTGTIGAVVPYNLVDPLGEAGGGRKVILPNMAELLAQDCEIAGAPPPVPCNVTSVDVTIPFSGKATVTTPPGNGSETEAVAEIAAVEAARSAAARGASPEE